MMKILLTGGNGFIGKNIKESYLAQKYIITAPSSLELNCYDDKSVAEFFKKQSFDVIIHAAAKAGHRNALDTSNLCLTNSRMIFNLLKYQNSWGKLLNMGSGAIYDMQHYQPKMPESYFGTHIPKDEHGYNKYILGKLLPSLHHVYDLRIFGIFGKYEDYTIRFISNAICKSIFDLPITLRQNRKFDYLYIVNFISILEYFIDYNPIEKSFNITPNNAIELLEIAQLVKKISGKEIAIEIEKNGLGLEYSGDNSLLKAHIEHLKFIPIEQSVEELYCWYSKNKNNLNKKLLLIDK